MDEWITMRTDFSGDIARMYINDQKAPTFIVNKLLGRSRSGAIGLWIDIGTEGYFKDLKITKRALKDVQGNIDKINDISL